MSKYNYLYIPVEIDGRYNRQRKLKPIQNCLKVLKLPILQLSKKKDLKQTY